MKTSLYLEELLNITRTLSSRPESEELLKKILFASLNASGADEGSLMLLDEETQTLRVKVGLGLPEEVYMNIRIKIGQPIAGLVLQSGKPLLLGSQLRKDSRFTNLPGGEKKIRSALCLPLKVMEQTIGVLNLNIIKSKKRFSQKDLSLLEVFTTVVAISLEHAGLYSTTTRHTEEMKLINKLGEALGTVFDEEQILKLMATTCKTMMEVDIFSLVNLSNHWIKFKILSQRPLSKGLKKQFSFEILQLLVDLTGIEYSDTEVVIEEEIKDVNAEEISGPLASNFSLPLVTKDKIIGLIRIDSLQKNKFTQENIRFLSALTPQVAIAIENAQIYFEMQELYAGIISALSAELETRNPYTLGHSERVTEYAVMTAMKMNLSAEEIAIIRYGGLLHDIGKIGVADNILLKAGPLVVEEWEEIKKHPSKSEGIVKFVSFLKTTLPIIRSHHERYDGQGYPDRLKGDEIPVGARIIACADAFDAITSKRPYRDKRSIDDALEIIKNCAGTQFDPNVVAAFISVVNR